MVINMLAGTYTFQLEDYPLLDGIKPNFIPKV